MKKSPLKALGTALFGSVIGAILKVLFMEHPPTTLHDWLTLAPSAIIGAIVGWGYGLATSLQSAADNALSRLELATRALDIQEEPLQMLVTTRHHPESLGLLLSHSMKEKYRYISYVDENKYLMYLITAIAESKSYQGVQRFPVRWFSVGERKKYLQMLRDQKMRKKIRIFILDESQKELMEADLADNEMMSFYWSNTGHDVETYWITTTDLLDSYRGAVVPGDFALYDHELLIEYDDSTRTLFFDLIKPDDSRHFVFRSLATQQQSKTEKPFKRIVAPKAKEQSA